MLSLEELRADVERGAIDTVVVAFTDMQGRLLGKRLHAEYFLGYDVRVDRWVRFGAHSNAQYYGMVGKRADNVWSWSYVLPGPSGSAVWTKQSDVEYTIDGPSYPKNGTLVTEHHRCRKG